MKHTVYLKTSEIPLELIIKNNISPCDRDKFLEFYKELVKTPCDQFVLDRLDVLTHELNESFSSWNVRWEDVIGETVYTDIKYLIWGFPFCETIYYSLLKEKSDTLDKIRNDFKKLKWFNFFKKDWYKTEIRMAERFLADYRNITKQTILTPSFKRNWYLDVYY
jgi:hypothetical protein